jgi:trimeric autotransporter adhesin
MFCVASPHDRSDFRSNPPQRKVAFALAACLTLFLLFASFAVGQNIINTVAGNYVASTTPTGADMPGPTAAIQDSQGNLYVAAPYSQYIFEMSGSSVTAYTGMGWVGYWGKTTTRLKGLLAEPTGLAMDTQGNLYIADSGNNSVRKVDTSGNLSTVAGISEPCPQAKCGDGGPAISAKLNGPQSVAVDSKGNVYIADTGDSRVRCVIAVAGGCGGSTKPVGTIIGFAGSLTSCAVSTSSCGDGGPATSAMLNSPAGISLDSSGNVYISDTGDNRIREIVKHVINTIAGTGKYCFGSESCGNGGSALSAYLGAPRGLWVVSPTLYYIADTRTNTIRVVTSGTIAAFAGDTAVGFKGDGGLPTAAKLSGPMGVWANAAGDVFIADSGNQRIREVTGTGSGAVINTVLGGGNGGDGGAATSAELAQPYTVALDSNNNYYIADTANNRVRVVNTQTSAITVATVSVPAGAIATIAGNGEFGYAKGNNGTPALTAAVNGPEGVAVDSTGNIYITDPSDGIVWEVNNGTGVISIFAGDFQPCNAPAPGCGDGGSATNAQLSAPSSLAIDGSGNIFITDPVANRIREVSNGTISTVAGTGTSGYSGDGGLATAAELSRPFGVAVDALEDLYIADSNNNVLRCVLGAVGGCGGLTNTVGNIVTFAYNGNEVFQGDGGAALSATRWNPTEVAVDSRGNVFVGGGNDDLVQRIDIAPPNIVVTVAGNDLQYWWYAYCCDGKPAIKARIDNAGLAVDSNQNLLIADVGNNRIREVANLIAVGTATPTTLNFGDVKVGQKSSPMPVTLQNTGSNDLVISTIGTSGVFTQTNTCPASTSSLVPSASCTVSVTFTPTKTGVVNGTLTISDNGFYAKQTVKLTGTGD